MKNLYSLLLSLTLLLGLCACGQAAATWQEQYDLGVKYLSDGNYEEAIIAFTAAIEIDPQQPLAYIGRGDAYIGSGETEENLAAAQVDYEQAIALDETNPEVYLKAAEVYLALDMKEAARNILKQGYEITHDDNLRSQMERISLARTERDPGELNGQDGYVITTYNDDGWPIQQKWYYIDDAPGSVYLYEYNENGILMGVERQQPSEGPPYSSYAYNLKGQRVRDITYYENHITENEYYYDNLSGVVKVNMHITGDAMIETELSYTMESPENSIRIGGYSYSIEESQLVSYYISESKPFTEAGQIYTDQVKWTEFNADGTIKVRNE